MVTLLMLSALILFFAVFFKSFKALLLGSIDEGVAGIVKKLSDSEELRETTVRQLFDIQQEFAAISEKYKFAIEESKAEANVLLENTMEKIVHMRVNCTNTLEEYKKQREIEILESVKKNVSIVLNEMLTQRVKDRIMLLKEL